MRSRIPSHRRQSLSFVPFDLQEFDDEAERQEQRRVIRDAAYRTANEATVRRYYLEDYDFYVSKGLTYEQLQLALSDRMPPKRKAGEPVRFTKTKQQRTTSKYGGTGKKYTNKYKHDKSMDSAMIAAAVKAEAAKAVSRSIETQYSQCMIRLANTTGTALPPGGVNSFSMIGLNQAFVSNAFTFKPNQMMCFNLSALSQVRSGATTNISGYRVGNKVNVNRLTVNVVGAVGNLVADCTYHTMLVRRKDGAGASNYLTPALVGSDQTELYKPLTDGPLAGSSVMDSSQVPDTSHLSMTRRNTDAWSFVSGGHSYQSLKVPFSGWVCDVNFGLSHEFNDTWDFTSPNPGINPVLKNGDYFLYVWREGNPDSGASNLDIYLNLSFKETS